MDYSLDDGATWTNVPGDSSPLVISGLSNGTTYDVRLRARNAIGVGAASALRQLTPARAPDAPTISSISRGNGQLTVNFSTGFDGGSAITNIEHSTDGGQNWTTPDPASASSPLTLTGLTNGTTYAVKVRAVNDRGSGAASISVNGTPATVASAPSISAVTGGDGSAQVTFVLGASNGAAATNIEYSTDDGLTWTTRNPASTSSPLPLPGLVNGTPYQVRLRAVNAMGTGSQSAATAVTPARAPDAPTITSATGENGRAVIAFVPNGNGGNAISNYAYSLDDGVTWTTRSPASTVGPIIVTGLTNGTSYPVRLKAINTIGAGDPSPAVTALPSGPPLAPTITSVTGSNGTLSVAFNEGSNGGAPVTAYQVSTDGGATWAAATGTTSPLQVPGLVNGVSYSVAIRAVNSRGPGTASSAEPGVPSTVPDAPQITQVISASGAVDVAFALGGDGGSTITNISYSIDNGDTWTVRTPPSIAGPLRLTGLSNGTTYPVRIRAINVRGQGADSATVSALPATTPDAPAVTSVTSGNGNLMVAFTPPASNGGAPVLGYQYSLDGGDNWAAAVSTVSPMEINNVTVGTEYDVAIRAVNLRGAGTASNAATKRATAPPAPPTITSVQTGNGEIVVRYAPPSDTGGDALQDFFYSLDGGVTWSNTATAQSLAFPRGGMRGAPDFAAAMTSAPVTTSTATTLRIGNLVNGQSYELALRASNADALGIPSVTVQGIPSTVPSVPRNLSVVTGDSMMTVSWQAPLSNGGLAISRYEYSIDGGTVWNDVADNPTVLRGLRNGTTYDVKVRAFNDNGASVATASAVAKPTTVPRAVAAPSATAGTDSVTLSWSAPTDDGGSPVTDYVIEYSSDGGDTWQAVADGVSTATTVSVSNLSAGRAYLFRVTPVNAVGTGVVSIASNASTPVAAAAAPVTAPVTQPVLTPQTPAAPIATPIATPVTKPVKKPKKSQGAAAAVPDATVAVDNSKLTPVNDGAGTVFGVPEKSWVTAQVEDGAYTVRTGEKLVVRISLKSGIKLNLRGMPVFRIGDTFDVSVSGLLPGSDASLWIFSTPTLLGEGTADASGALSGAYRIPMSVTTGDHTVQLNGLAPDGTLRSAEVKIEVLPAATDDTDTTGGSTDDDSASGSPTDGNGSLPTGLILMAAFAGLIMAAGLVMNRRRRSTAGNRTDD
ncbi:MAG: fibronectin type III domain-containing protein [Ilumatobacteraceae bacterium]